MGLKPLEARGLVTHDDHRFLVLTPGGERAAREVHHRFAVLHKFLRDVLGIPEEQATSEACRMEHAVSGPTAERLLDLVRLLREDSELGSVFRRRLEDYHRTCRPITECSTCDLSCLTEPPSARS